MKHLNRPVSFASFIKLLDELITAHREIVFRTTSNDIGEKASQIVPERPVLHGVNMTFSRVSCDQLPKFEYRQWAREECSQAPASRPDPTRCATMTTAAIGKANPSDLKLTTRCLHTCLKINNHKKKMKRTNLRTSQSNKDI